MKDIERKLKKHVAHDDYLDKNDVIDLITKYPELKYSGVAYRMLVFSLPTKKCKLDDDSSFSYDLSGIKEYSYVQDLEYYKYIQLYRVDLVGLNLEKALSLFNLEQAPIIQREKEIILGMLNEQELLFNDKSELFDEYLSSLL